MEISNNSDYELAYRIIEYTGANLFLTGRAGTGKTTFLRSLISRTHKQLVIAAPTGIAAINAGGVTLHSLFQLDFGLFLPGMNRKAFKFSREKIKLIKFMDVLVIDEVSMVRADLLDAVDDVLRRMRNPRLPFGGVQLLLIGDLRQLPPVVTDSEQELLSRHYPTPYFFSSKALTAAGYVTVELQKVYRQEDPSFLHLLGEIREGNPSAEVCEALNKRYIPNFKPEDSEHWVQLSSHNASANAINRQRMDALPAAPYTYNSVITGNFPKGVCPAEDILTLKQGAQVMFVKNEPGPQHRYYNGLIGTVTRLDETSVTVLPDNGTEPICVKAVDWENISYTVNAQTGEVEEYVDGTFKQIPLRAAWAITIHKSQGLTFSRAIIDASACFAHGQAYVALSRLRSIDGLVLSSPIPMHAIISDATVSNFLSTQQASRPNENMLLNMEKQYSLCLLNSVYNFEDDLKKIDDLHRIIIEAYQRNFPSLVKEYGAKTANFTQEIIAPAKTFALQYTRLLYTPDSLPMLTERLAASAGYFPNKIKPIISFLENLPLEIDNKKTLKRLKLHRDMLMEGLEMKAHLISSFANQPFSNESLLKSKREFLTRHDALPTKKKKGKATSSTRNTDSSTTVSSNKGNNPDEVNNPQLFNALVTWRRSLAKEMNVPAFTIISTKALIAISNRCPLTQGELLMLKGCGVKTVEKYGNDILKVIRSAAH